MQFIACCFGITNDSATVTSCTGEEHFAVSVSTKGSSKLPRGPKTSYPVLALGAGGRVSSRISLKFKINKVQEVPKKIAALMCFL